MLTFTRARLLAAPLATALLVGGALTLSAAPAGAGAAGDEATFRTEWDTPGPTTIDLTADITLTCAGGGQATRTVDGAVTVNGNGHAIAIEAGCADRVLEVTDESDSAVTLNNVTVRGGRNPDSYGGGLLMDNGDAGPLHVVDSTFTDNVNCDDGGAIDYEGSGTVTIERSTIAGNTSTDSGGAMWAGDADIVVVNSTIADNVANTESAFENDGGTTTLVYSDVIGNRVEATDCPVADGATAEVGHGDAGSSAAEDGQLSTQVLAAFGSVVAEPVNSSNCVVDGLTTTSEGVNFSDDSTCGFDNTVEGDRQDAGPPGLGPLASNGGPTQTLLPDPTSPLVDFIPVDACGDGDELAGGPVTTDQRGVARPQGSGCEIGSVELEPEPAPAPLVLEPTFTG